MQCKPEVEKVVDPASLTRRKYFQKLGLTENIWEKYHDIRSFANKNSSVVLNSSTQLKKMPFSIVFILSLRLTLVKTWKNWQKIFDFDTRLAERKIFFPAL